jgi:signal transduction histidine kinase
VVAVVEDETTVRVTVCDHGQGFDVTDSIDGFGLLGMRERAESLDGTITVDSASGRETTITADLPVQRRESKTTPPGLVFVLATGL